MRSCSILDLLLRSRPGALHVLDPFKIHVEEAILKARTLERFGVAALLIGSTDCVCFEEYVAPYVAHLKSSTRLSLILHFPPKRGIGYRICDKADGVILHNVLNSTDDYYAGRCTVETFDRWVVSSAEGPEALVSASFTFGPDAETSYAVGAIPTKETSRELARYAESVAKGAFDLAYLYSRHASVPLIACQEFRQRAKPRQLLFVSGGVRTRAQVDAYLKAGADFVVFGTALETKAWRCAVDDILGTAATHSHLVEALRSHEDRQ
jgi:heptaprenylglyceryl phosphate synthase